MTEEKPREDPFAERHYCEVCGESILTKADEVALLGGRYMHRDCWFNSWIQSKAFKRRYASGLALKPHEEGEKGEEKS